MLGIDCCHKIQAINCVEFAEVLAEILVQGFSVLFCVVVFVRMFGIGVTGKKTLDPLFVSAANNISSGHSRQDFVDLSSIFACSLERIKRDSGETGCLEGEARVHTSVPG